jgi:hypothetical protein
LQQALSNKKLPAVFFTLQLFMIAEIVPERITHPIAAVRFQKNDYYPAERPVMICTAGL